MSKRKIDFEYLAMFLITLVIITLFIFVFFVLMPNSLSVEPEPKTKTVTIEKENLLDAIKLLVEITPLIPIEDMAEENKPFFPLTDSERYTLECIVCGEAGNQEYNGKVAVASCILNAAIKDNISISEVRKRYQYSGWKDINQYEAECMKAYGNTTFADEVRQAVKQVFDNGEVISKDILWFYNPDIVYSHFHETKTKFYFKIDDMKYFGPKE